jgi:D-proline reductase (dithiol) PrdB
VSTDTEPRPAAGHPEVRTSDGLTAAFPPPDVVAKRRETYDEWVRKVTSKRPIGHETVQTRAVPLRWTPCVSPLSARQVALVSTGGVHLATQQPFAVFAEDGDHSVREIPGDADTRDLVFTHTHYATDDATQDPNVMFPLDRLRELAGEGIIRSVSPVHYGFMGFIPDPGVLVRDIVPAIGRELVRRGTDTVILTPG